jgi:hypothetical protein
MKFKRFQRPDADVWQPSFDTGAGNMFVAHDQLVQ